MAMIKTKSHISNSFFMLDVKHLDTYDLVSYDFIISIYLFLLLVDQIFTNICIFNVTSFIYDLKFLTTDVATYICIIVILKFNVYDGLLKTKT